jgi:SAM-dependent methyltransferase
MDRLAYERAAATLHAHWWFTARAVILERLLASLSLPRPARILEIGCGAGANLPVLRAFGSVAAVEQDSFSRDQARARHDAEVLPGSLPDDLPYADRRFDLVCLFDVLEHVERDEDALRAARERLAPEGVMIVTVPAYQWLYSAHDRSSHHLRRYTARRLENIAGAASLRPVRLGYYNTFLFPFAAIGRLASRGAGGTGEDPLVLPPAPLNRLLHRVFAAESALIGRTFFPYGLSVIGLFKPTTANR